ncbi:MAG: hypothetical protein ACLR8U_08620 [Oscillospiraceae bacterium]
MTGLQAAILGGSALILLVLALRLGLQRHLPRRLFPALWCAAAVRLLPPVSIPTRLSIWNLFERTSASAAAGTVSRTLLPFPDLTDGRGNRGGLGSSGACFPAFHRLAGGNGAASRICEHRLYLYGARIPVRADRALPIYGRAAGSVSLSQIAPHPRHEQPPRVMTFGVLRPVILLPEGLAAESEPFRLVLAHELAHVKRRDCV